MAVLQVFQAQLLKSLDEGGADPEAFKDLRTATDFALKATKKMAQAIGRSMGYTVVLHRHLWLTLTELKDTDRRALLNAPVSPSGLFGDAVEAITKRFSEAQKCSRAMSHFLPRRAAGQPPAHNRSSTASNRPSKRPPSSSASLVPNPELAVHTKTMWQRTPKGRYGFKKGGRPDRGTPPSEQKPRTYTRPCRPAHTFSSRLTLPVNRRSWTLANIQRFHSPRELSEHDPGLRRRCSECRRRGAPPSVSFCERMAVHSGHFGLVMELNRERIHASVSAQTTPVQRRGHVDSYGTQRAGVEARNHQSPRETHDRSGPAK